MALTAGARPAAAHEGEGALALQVADPPAPTGPGSVRYQVLLTFLNDGHPAPDATVTVVAEQSGASGRVGPLTMAPGAAEGTYEATVAFPSAGSWTVRFTAVTPAAAARVGPGGPTGRTRPDHQRSAATSAAPGHRASVPPATTATVAVPTSGSADPGDDEGGSSWLPVVVAAILVAAVVGIGATALVRSRRTRPDGPSPPS